MTTRTLTRLFDNHDDAVAVVQSLEAAGFRHDDVSIVASNSDTRYPASTTGAVVGDDASGAGAGASLGTVLGGGAGLLAGIGALAIPGVGPVVAAGWLVATLTGAGVGATAGGLLGGLTHAGVAEDDAHVYTEGVRRGGSLVTARVDEMRAAEAESILNGRTYVDPAARRAEYKQGGWERFDDTAPAYVTPGYVAPIAVAPAEDTLPLRSGMSNTGTGTTTTSNAI